MVFGIYFQNQSWEIAFPFRRLHASQESKFNGDLSFYIQIDLLLEVLA